jgi:hypothetical protein
MRNARIVVFDLSNGLPAFPGTWTREDNGWYTAQVGGIFGAVCVLGGNGAGKFLGVVVCTDISQLAQYTGAAGVTKVWNGLPALFVDGGAAAIAVKTRWPTWRVTGTDGGVAISNALRTLTTPLPTLSPSSGSPLVDGALSITSLDALAFPRTIAGWTDDQDAVTGGP